jgi:hypothetical protein
MEGQALAEHADALDRGSPKNEVAAPHLIHRTLAPAFIQSTSSDFVGGAGPRDATAEQRPHRSAEALRLRPPASPLDHHPKPAPPNLSVVVEQCDQRRPRHSDTGVTSGVGIACRQPQAAVDRAPHAPNSGANRS